MGRGRNNAFTATGDAFTVVLGNRRGKILSTKQSEQIRLTESEESELYREVMESGTVIYRLGRKGGLVHRVHGPAIEFADGAREVSEAKHQQLTANSQPSNYSWYLQR